MKFSINKIILWLKDGHQRILSFDQNKVNVITGDSGTGKTSILGIIDYCLLSTEAKISQKVINENVAWYGINFNINGSIYTIARKSFEEDKKASDDIYFSSIGEIPDIPSVSIENKNLKSILEKEFSINENLVIPYGGKRIQGGSKISYRYFLLFNTQGENIISNTDNAFFDFGSYSDPDKYKEVLDRIFDLVIGANTIEDILMKERLDSIDKEIEKLNRQKKAFEKEDLLFKKDINDILLRAKEYSLVDENTNADDEGIKKLKEVLLGKIGIYKNNYSAVGYKDKVESDSVFELQKQKIVLLRKLQGLKNLEREYKIQNNMISLEIDSLLPVNYLIRNYSSLLTTPSTQKLLNSLKEERELIREKNKNHKPIEINVTPKIKELQLRLREVEEKLGNIPTDKKSFSNSAEKFIFMGEIKAKIEFYEKEVGNDNFDVQMEDLNSQRDELLRNLGNKKSNKESIMLLLNELIENYLKSAGDALGAYSEYKPFFNEKEKKLGLRKPNTAVPEQTIGSSSNYLFLHLALFLGLHELFLIQKTMFVPQFIILDQLSRPYFENDVINSDDKKKLTKAFEIIDGFISKVNSQGNSFQIIVLEHAPKSIWEDAYLKNIKLVEEFKDGNALIQNLGLKDQGNQ